MNNFHTGTIMKLIFICIIIIFTIIGCTKETEINSTKFKKIKYTSPIKKFAGIF